MILLKRCYVNYIKNGQVGIFHLLFYTCACEHITTRLHINDYLLHGERLYLLE